MNKPRKPRLTARIVEGLHSLSAFAEAELMVRAENAEGHPDEEERVAKMSAANEYIGLLATWYDLTHGRTHPPS